MDKAGEPHPIPAMNRCQEWSETGFCQYRDTCSKTDITWNVYDVTRRSGHSQIVPPEVQQARGILTELLTSESSSSTQQTPQDEHNWQTDEQERVLLKHEAATKLAKETAKKLTQTMDTTSIAPSPRADTGSTQTLYCGTCGRKGPDITTKQDSQCPKTDQPCNLVQQNPPAPISPPFIGEMGAGGVGCTNMQGWFVFGHCL